MDFKEFVETHTIGEIKKTYPQIKDYLDNTGLWNLPDNLTFAKAFEDIVTKSIKVDERPADERHKHSQEQYYNKLKLGDNYYNVDIFVDFLEKKNNEFRYAGHKTTKIENKISTRDTQVINHILLTKVDSNIINDVEKKYNPNIVKKRRGARNGTFR